MVTGPRQAGKTTLCRFVCGKTHRFVTLEDPDVRMHAKEDPRSFLEAYEPPIVIDEIQYVPELLSYIKTAIDARRKAGQWVITGSQNFTLMHGVVQSLAGRAAILSLLPFSYAERENHGAVSASVSALLRTLSARQTVQNKGTISESILWGSYPEIASRRSVDRKLWCGSYISTYLERDVRTITQVGDLHQFERFLRLCAIRTGQIFHLSDVARDVGVSVPTAKRWLSLLETSYQIYLLYPYYRNIGKRLVKSPKLYFNDTALASYLLGIHDTETLMKSPHFGNLFETFIITDFWKRFLHHGEAPSLYYLRTRDGLEIDLVIEEGQKLHLFEVKSAATIMPAHAASLRKARQTITATVQTTAIISRSQKNTFVSRDVVNYAWKNILGR